MDKHIKINGICVGMTKSEAWDILRNKGFQCNPTSIDSVKPILFCNIYVTIHYRLNKSLKIDNILILWTEQCVKEDIEAKSITGKESIFRTLERHFNGLLPLREKRESNYCEYIDLYNYVSIFKQDGGERSKYGGKTIDCVMVIIEDFLHAIDDKDKVLVEFARNSYCNKENVCNKHQIEYFPEKKNKMSLVKIIVVILAFILGLLYVQNNRYYYSNNGKIRVDKWKNERAIINSNGEYIKK